MIVRIPSIDEKLPNLLDAEEVREQYQEFFQFVSDLVGRDIKCLSDYYNALNDPKVNDAIYSNDNGRYLRINLTEPLFTVDLNKRIITVPEEFGKTGAIVRGDHMAEVLYFKVPRFFDEMDLGACQCEFECITAESSRPQYRFPIYKIEIMEENTNSFIESDPSYGEADEGFLIIGWYITKEVTAKDGNVTFSMRFYQEDENHALTFNLSTIPTTIKILPSFNLKDDFLDHDKFAKIDYQDLSSRLSYAGVINSMGVKPVIVYYSWDKKAYVNFEDSNGVEVTIKARDLDSAKVPLQFKWEDENGIVAGANTKPIKDEDGIWSCSTKLTKAGRYVAWIGNYVNDKGTTTEPAENGETYDRISWISSQPIYIPAAENVTLDLSGIALKGYTTQGAFDNIVPVSSLDVHASVPSNGEDGKFIYTWYKDGTPVAQNTEQSELEITEELQNGDFYVSAHYEINGTRSKTETNTADTMIILRPAPVQPDSKNFSINMSEQDNLYECLPTNNAVDTEDLQYYWMVYDDSASVQKNVKIWSPENTVTLNEIEAILDDKQFNGEDKLICKVRQVRFVGDELYRESDHSDEIKYPPVNAALL